MMQHRILLSTILALAASGLIGCATQPLPDGTALPASISFNPSVCYGTCPDYKVTVRSDGTATWEGRQFVEAKGVRQFSVSDEEYRAFARALAPIRPQGTRNIVDGAPDCGPAATDHETTIVEWEDAATQDKLTFYHGCHNPANRVMAETISAAPKLLPIATFIGDPATTKP